MTNERTRTIKKQKTKKADEEGNNARKQVLKGTREASEQSEADVMGQAPRKQEGNTQGTKNVIGCIVLYNVI